MKKEGFLSEQIKAISKRSGLIMLVAELIRHVETSKQTFCPQQKKCTGLEGEQVRDLKAAVG